MSRFGIQKRNNGEVNVFDAFDDFFRPVFFDEYNPMRTDVKESDEGYHLDIEIAGFKKDEINVSLEDGYLTVSAKKESKDDKSKYVRREISESYQRTFYVGDDISENDVKAKYENGILELDIPKSQPKQIQSHSINIE